MGNVKIIPLQRESHVKPVSYSLLTFVRFVEVIYDDIWEPCYNDLKAARFISVLAGAATDVSIRDLEGIYVRFLKDGQPNNMFGAVEELKHATATGHCEAINAALEKVGLNDWKEKTVGFGSDGAAVSVNDVGECQRFCAKRFHN
ncbi:hypothetical protein SKAU_G00424160 [Synaphobranchus kaupii]|uniref:Uncharacterized protein n=1 Tax=Synaphobranchus kaupii TaxID=118154 RepID=A0A9Q1IAL8_SYNKA|nr:hypothetical protein SKAU_G00424160 [Synaphobranchus kaupii]